MAGTIENTNQNILNKLKCLSEILEFFNRTQLEEPDTATLKATIQKFEEVNNNYELGTIEYLTNYTTKVTNEKQKYYDNFMYFIVTENIIGKLETIFNFCQKLKKSYYVEHIKEFPSNAYDKFIHSQVTIQQIKTPNLNCFNCNAPYTLDPKNSEVVCSDCGNSERLKGVVFEDEQFFYQEGRRTKHGKYDPTKHCKFWVERIQAKEGPEIPKEVIDAVKSCIKRDQIWLENVTCPMIRGYLKELRKTAYNDHVPYIRKQITGKEPPQLLDSELKLIYVYFAQVIQIYNKTKPENKPNCPYHPFFIYKIIEHIYRDTTEVEKKKEILSCIHLQSHRTLIENDRIWLAICNELPEIEYKPTC